LNYIGVPLLLKYVLKKNNFSITLNCGYPCKPAQLLCQVENRWKRCGRNTILPAVIPHGGTSCYYWNRNRILVQKQRATLYWPISSGGKSIASGIDGTAFNRVYVRTKIQQEIILTLRVSYFFFMKFPQSKWYNST
jgi:hypothetical protein